MPCTCSTSLHAQCGAALHALHRLCPASPMMPRSISQPAHAKPACREATLVRLMTPLFCANVVRGSEVARAEKMPLMPSLNRAPAAEQPLPLGRRGDAVVVGVVAWEGQHVADANANNAPAPAHRPTLLCAALFLHAAGPIKCLVALPNPLPTACPPPLPLPLTLDAAGEHFA